MFMKSAFCVIYILKIEIDALPKCYYDTQNF